MHIKKIGALFLNICGIAVCALITLRAVQGEERFIGTMSTALRLSPKITNEVREMRRQRHEAQMQFIREWYAVPAPAPGTIHRREDDLWFFLLLPALL